MGMQRQRSEFYARYRILYPRSECNRAHLRWFHALQKAAEAALDQAEAQYRATVITAFQNVADALRALQSDARAVKAARRAEDTAKASLDIVQKQLNAGQVNQLAVLNAQQTYLTAYACRRKPIVSPIPPHCLWRSAAVGPRPAQHRRFEFQSQGNRSLWPSDRRKAYLCRLGWRQMTAVGAKRTCVEAAKSPKCRKRSLARNSIC
jgi:hypothetical protein